MEARGQQVGWRLEEGSHSQEGRMEGYSGLSLAGSPQGESQDKASENLSDSKNLSNQNKDFNAVFKKKKKFHDT